MAPSIVLSSSFHFPILVHFNYENLLFHTSSSDPLFFVNLVFFEFSVEKYKNAPISFPASFKSSHQTSLVILSFWNVVIMLVFSRLICDLETSHPKTLTVFKIFKIFLTSRLSLSFSFNIVLLINSTWLPSESPAHLFIMKPPIIPLSLSPHPNQFFDSNHHLTHLSFPSLSRRVEYSEE